MCGLTRRIQNLRFTFPLVSHKIHKIVKIKFNFCKSFLFLFLCVVIYFFIVATRFLLITTVSGCRRRTHSNTITVFFFKLNAFQKFMSVCLYYVQEN